MISRTEYLAELERLYEAQKRNDDGHTADEIAEIMGRHVGWVRKLLKKAMTEGRLKRGHRTTMGLDGRNYQTPVYVLEPEK